MFKKNESVQEILYTKKNVINLIWSNNNLLKLTN